MITLNNFIIQLQPADTIFHYYSILLLGKWLSKRTNEI